MPDNSQFHEDFSRAGDVKRGSERAFGLVFTAVFLIIGLWPLIAGLGPKIWALVIAGIFFSAALLVPNALRLFNLAWFKFGLMLHKIVNPLVMGLLFFLTITPMALIFRLIGKDPLNRKFDSSMESYWIKRTPPGPSAESMKNQF